MIAPDDPKHGTPTGYTYGCRQSCCKDAKREYQRAYGQDEEVRSGAAIYHKAKAQERKKSEPPKHGTLNAYNNYGCRCNPCRDARKAAYKPVGLLPRVTRRG